MSAVTERERRATAGRRMNVLVGKAAEDDEAFWGNEVWEEDNESFHASDEDSALLKDEFDSDFNDSEDEEDEDEVEAQVAAAREEDMELMKQERKGKPLVGEKAKKKIKNSKRIIGDGMNAGIVLNVPGTAPPAQITRKVESKAPQFLTSTLAATRPRRVNQLSKYTPRYRSAKNADVPLTENDSTKQQLRKPIPAQQKKSKKRKYTQEELLLEAANETEPENQRWLLARKRSQADTDHQKDSSNREVRGKVIERIVSRRGYLTTVTFPEMDHVPEILVRSRHTMIKPPEPELCVITGKAARYRDPKSGKGYYDAAAFKELRRRFDAGELDVPPAAKPVKSLRNSQSQTATSVIDNVQSKDNAKKINPPANTESVTESKQMTSQSNDSDKSRGNSERQSDQMQTKDSNPADGKRPDTEVDKQCEEDRKGETNFAVDSTTFPTEVGEQYRRENTSTEARDSVVEAKIYDGGKVDNARSQAPPTSASGVLSSADDQHGSPISAISQSETASAKPTTAIIKDEHPSTPKPIGEDEASPGSRKSPRRWKPTAKVLQSMDLVIPGLPVVSSSPQQQRQQTDQTDQTNRPAIKYHKS